MKSLGGSLTSSPIPNTWHKGVPNSSGIGGGGSAYQSEAGWESHSSCCVMQFCLKNEGILAHGSRTSWGDSVLEPHRQIQIPTASLTSCVASGKFLNLSVPQFGSSSAQ